MDSLQLFSGSSDKTAALWETGTGKRLQRFVRHRDNVATVAASLDGSVLISGGWDKKIILWDVKTGGHVRECRGVHSKSVTAVAVSADGTKAISGSADRRVGIWDLRTGQPLFTFASHSDVITSVSITADGKVAISSAADGSINSWDTEAGQLILRYNDPDVLPLLPDEAGTLLPEAGGNSGNSGGAGAGAAAAAASPTSTSPSSKDRPPSVPAVPSAASAAGALLARAHIGSVHAIVVSVRGDFVLSTGADRTLKLWNVQTGALVERVDTEPEEISSLALTPHGGLFVVAVKNTVEHWVLDWVLEYVAAAAGGVFVLEVGVLVMGVLVLVLALALVLVLLLLVLLLLVLLLLVVLLVLCCPVVVFGGYASTHSAACTFARVASVLLLWAGTKAACTALAREARSA